MSIVEPFWWYVSFGVVTVHCNDILPDVSDWICLLDDSEVWVGVLEGDISRSITDLSLVS